MQKSKLSILSKLLVIIGALNWGLVGFLNLDLVAIIFGKKSIISKVVYALVGLSGAYLVMDYRKRHPDLKKELRRAKGEKTYSGKQYSWSGIQ